jgi:hypothetical protein
VAFLLCAVNGDSSGFLSSNSIVLRPDSTLLAYGEIVLSEEQAEYLWVVAELVAVLG